MAKFTSESAAVQLAEPALQPAPGEELGPTLEFLRLVWALNHAMEVSSRRSKARLGVTGPQRLVLRLVGMFPGLPPGALARLMHVHPATLSPVISELVRRGYLQRSRDNHDGRLTRLQVTAGGQRVARERRGTVEATLEQALAGLDPARVTQAREVLLRLSRALEAEHQAALDAE